MSAAPPPPPPSAGSPSGSPSGSVGRATLLILIDGLGDVTVRQLADRARHPHGRTPMQAARMPNMDRLARQCPERTAAQQRASGRGRFGSERRLRVRVWRIPAHPLPRSALSSSRVSSPALASPSPSSSLALLPPGSGLCGLMDSVEVGQACGSDTAHLSLLGFDPLVYYRGRGAFESMGAGLEMEVGDIAFKSNFATIAATAAGANAAADADAEGATAAAPSAPTATSAAVPAPAAPSSAIIHPASLIPSSSPSSFGPSPPPLVLKRRADRSFHSWGIPLCAALDGARLPSFPEVEVSVRYATEHRCGVRLRGPGLTDCITGTDPLVDGRPLRVCRPTDASEQAKHTARIVNEVSQVFQRILARHPINMTRSKKGLPVANCVLLRGAGARIQVPQFVSPSYDPSSPVSSSSSSSSCSPRACMVAPTAIIRGLGRSVGFDILPCSEGTGDYRTNLQAKADTILRAMMPRATTTTTPKAGAVSSPSGMDKAPSSQSSDGLDPSSPSYSFGFLHIKAVDDAGHDRDLRRKVEWLEKCDQMVGDIIARLTGEHASSGAGAGDGGGVSGVGVVGGVYDTLWTLVITGDHSTPVVYGDHACEPVPVLVTTLQHLEEQGDATTPNLDSPDHRRRFAYSPTMVRLLSSSKAQAFRHLVTHVSRGGSNPVATFDEIACATADGGGVDDGVNSGGALGRFPGRELMPLLRRVHQAVV